MNAQRTNLAAAYPDAPQSSHGSIKEDLSRPDPARMAISSYGPCDRIISPRVTRIVQSLAGPWQAHRNGHAIEMPSAVRCLALQLLPVA